MSVLFLLSHLLKVLRGYLTPVIFSKGTAENASAGLLSLVLSAEHHD